MQVFPTWCWDVGSIRVGLRVTSSHTYVYTQQASHPTAMRAALTARWGTIIFPCRAHSWSSMRHRGPEPPMLQELGGRWATETRPHAKGVRGLAGSSCAWRETEVRHWAPQRGSLGAGAGFMAGGGDRCSGGHTP